MVTFENAQYSVPYRLMGQDVWARNEGAGQDTRVVIVHVGDDGPVEVARHRKRDAGVVVNGAHYPDREEYIPGFKKPRAKTPTEAQFLAVGDGAARWLQEAASNGVEQIQVKMAQAVQLAKLQGHAVVDHALGLAAINSRFAHGDLRSIVESGMRPSSHYQAPEERSLAQGTKSWAGFGAAGQEGS